MKILIFIYEHLKRNIHAREIKYLPEKSSYASNMMLIRHFVLTRRRKLGWYTHHDTSTRHSILSRL